MKFERNDLLLAMKNDNVAFENIYKSIYADLYKMAYYIMGNGELAKDIVGETVLDAYAGITKLRDASKFEPWILKILTNKCNCKIKEKYEKFSVFHPQARNIDDLELKAEKPFSEKEEKTDVQIALSKLSREDKLIVTLCVVEGYKSHEVAKILSMNPSTVRSKLNRALKKMKKYLEVKADEK